MKNSKGLIPQILDGKLSESKYEETDAIQESLRDFVETNFSGKARSLLIVAESPEDARKKFKELMEGLNEETNSTNKN